MDFNGGGLERADVYIGDKASVDIEITPDKEVDYHTHPPDKELSLSRENSFPSRHDIRTFKDYPSQSMIIFHNDKASITTKTKQFNGADKQSLDKVYSGLDRDSKSMTADQLFRKYKPAYKLMGLNLKYIKSKGKINIPINVVEPI